MPLSVASDRWIDFCIWVLEVDGLQVPPFDRHGPGDGSLRALGLDAAGWIAWLKTVVTQQGRREMIENAPLERWTKEIEAGEQPEASAFTEEERREVQALNQQTPALMWQGDRRMVEALSELWWQYSRLDTRAGLDLQRPVGGPELEVRLGSHAAHLPRLRILLVDYPGIVAYAVPPDTVILAVRGPRLPATAYNDAVLSVVPQLAQPDEDSKVEPQPPGTAAPAMPAPASPPQGRSGTGPSPHLEPQSLPAKRDEPDGDALERLALRMLAFTYEHSMRGIGVHAGDAAAPRLLPKELPDDLPVDLPLPDEHDLLGSFTMRTHVMVLLETTLSPFQARDFYRAHLLDAGWTEAPTMGSRPTGFEARDGFTVPDVYCHSEHGPALILMVQPGSRLRTEVRLFVDTAVDSPRSPCSPRRRDAAAQVQAQAKQTIPELLPPDDSVQIHQGTANRANHHSSHARVHTHLPLRELLRHYEEQLEHAGWHREESGLVHALGWSVWSFASEEAGQGYGLFWVAQDPAQSGDYILTVEWIGRAPG